MSKPSKFLKNQVTINIILVAARVGSMPEVTYGAVNRLVKIVCPHLAEPPINSMKWMKNNKIINPVLCFQNNFLFLN